MELIIDSGLSLLSRESSMVEYGLSVQLLGMEREDCFAVVALEMDIWGYGETALSATENLQEHLGVQIAYLIQSRKVELIHRKAPTEYFAMYDECVIAQIKEEDVPGWWISTLTLPVSEKSNHRSCNNQSSKRIRNPAARYAAGVCRRFAA